MKPEVRRMLALGLAGFGAFLLVFSPLMRAVVAPRLLKAQADRATISRMYARSATFYDPSTARLRTGPVVLTRALNSDGSAGTGERAVWIQFSSLTTLEGDRIGYNELRLGIDRRSGAILDCCGAYVDGDSAVRAQGLIFRWPFGAARRAYDYFDALTKRSLPITYAGTEQISGVTVYRYTQHVPAAQVASADVPVPGRLMGLDAGRSYRVTRWSQEDRTLWVEPESGVIVKSEENLRQSFRTADGVERLVALSADLRTPDEEVAVNLGEAYGYTSWITTARVRLPIGSGVVGLAALVTAGVLLLRRRPPSVSALAEDQQEIPRRELADPR
ncbi:DUF3068 domain-containing protein [Streptosporangiaceae bacterium NEAU-GS5]|nr:DUF3068 domain-containing protein [Streptosporangiaceae bacterium NEAU-GS5]